MTKWEFNNLDSALESTKIEILKGNKVVIYGENKKIHTIIWETQKERIRNE